MDFVHIINFVQDIHIFNRTLERSKLNICNFRCILIQWNREISSINKDSNTFFVIETNNTKDIWPLAYLFLFLQFLLSIYLSYNFNKAGILCLGVFYEYVIRFFIYLKLNNPTNLSFGKINRKNDHHCFVNVCYFDRTI